MHLALRIIIAIIICAHAHAFTLLGPPADWMTREKNLGYETDSGGPMQLNAGYRWNLPEITYGYDLSFLNFFGERGVAAIEDAIHILNSYSDAEIRTFPTNVIRIRPSAQASNVIDLKTTALSALLKQMGLGDAHRYTYVLRDINITAQTTNYAIVQRNFDPVTHAPTDTLNLTRFAYDTRAFPDGTFDALEYPVDQSQHVNAGVAGSQFLPGEFVIGLTGDDVGGLRYLYATNNFKMETLPPGTTAVEGPLVDAALRPGRGKLKFRRIHLHPATLTNFYTEIQTYTDVFVQNGITQTQRVQRFIAQPDIVFSADDLGPGPAGEPMLLANGIHWNNNSALLGQPDEGPGTINPSGMITFQKLANSQGFHPQWGALDRLGGEFFFNPPFTDAPLPKLEIISGTLAVKLTGIRRKYTVSASDDFITWSNLTTISNETTSIFQVPLSTTGQKFYRVLEGAPY
jgi:hypothetical protein